MAIRAMVLAAGFGTRLRPLTDELPKPAVPVANKPLAWFVLNWLAANKVTEVAINTHHLAGRLRERLGPYIPRSMAVRFVHEPRILGTGGGVRNAWRPQSGDEAPFVVANGDVVFAPDLEAAIRAHQGMGAVATMVVRETDDPDRWGAIEVDPGGRVRRVPGAPESASGGLQRYMFAGVHLLHPRAWDDLPEQGCIVRNSYRRWLEQGEVIAAIKDDSPWLEVGTVDGYLRANRALASGRLKWPGIEVTNKNNILDINSSIGRDTSLEEAVVGQGASVASGVFLRRVVVWEGARAERDEQDAVVTPSRTVRV